MRENLSRSAVFKIIRPARLAPTTIVVECVYIYIYIYSVIYCMHTVDLNVCKIV